VASDSHEALQGVRGAQYVAPVVYHAQYRGDPRTVPEKENVSFWSSMTGRSMPSRVASSPLQ
jgi:hypothetical protein